MASVPQLVYGDGLSRTMTETPSAGDVLVAFFHGQGNASITGVSGTAAGGWTQADRVTSGADTFTQYWVEVWTADYDSAGTVVGTATNTSSTGSAVFVVRGTDGAVEVDRLNVGDGTKSGPSMDAGEDQSVVGILSAYQAGGITFPSSTTPGSGWTTPSLVNTGSWRTLGPFHRSPSGSATAHYVSASGLPWQGANGFVQVVVGGGAPPASTGSGEGEFGWAGTGSGFITNADGSGSGSFGWAGSGFGVGDGNQGSGSGTFGWAGTGSGLVPPLPFDSVNLPAPIPVGVAVDLLPIPAAIPAGVSEWPVVIQSHPMPALGPDLQRVTEGVDYELTEADYGRLHVWVDGVDVTYLRDVPAEILTWSSSSPNGDTAARLSFPQIAPWEQDDLGVTGDLLPFRKDAPVEIGIIRADDSIGLLWEGYLSSVGDSTGENRESTTFGCHGTLWQAAHTMHIPPLYLEPTDIGVLVARDLNAVPSRRYPATPEVETGIMSRERGSQTQSVLARDQDLLSTAWTDDLRQWTLVKVAPYTYRLALKDLTTVHATFTKGAPGVEVDLERDESTRVDAVYARGVAPSGGVWANWFWPGLDLYVPPPYLYASAGTNMTIGATDAGTLTGTGVSDWQRRVLELGYTGITVDGVFNSADAAAARWVQRLRGILVDGIVGPQTWNATWDVGAQALDLTAIRLPLAWKPEVERHLYTANGAVAGENPEYDSGIVRHAHDLNFGADVSKTTARPLAQRYLDIFGEAAWTGRVTVTTDPHEGTSRLEIREGMNLDIIGHGMVQVVDVEHTPIQSTFLVDERARDAMTVDALLARDRDARRDPVARPGNPSKLAQLDRNQIVQYEDESQAGWVPRLAINGSAGLYTVVPIFVSQTGSVASLEFRSSGPATAYSISIFGRPVTANQCKAWCPNPVTDSDGWYDNEELLRTQFGYIDTWGTPGNLGGYYPRQEGEGPLTGKMRDDAGFPFVSEVGGYLWVAIFAAGDCFVEGRLYPGVPL